MLTGWTYRVASAAGVVILSIVAVLIANHPVPQSLFTTHIPLFNRLDVTVLEGGDLQLALLLTIVALLGSQVPLYKPRPRRLLDVISISQKRVLVAGLALATLGYFRWSYRLPRATLVMAMGMLYVTVPLWFVWIRQRVPGDTEHALIVGDDTEQIRRIVTESDLPYIGYLCPTTVFRTEARAIADGGTELEHLGGLSRLEETLVERNVDTVVFAFGQTDREEFFGVLDVCYDNGVKVKSHGDYADTVLTNGGYGTLVDINIEPLDTLDYVFKRVFDVLFASAALLVLLPVFAAIAVTIKLDSDGPVFFSQKRTSRFGGEFTFYKFRTMVENAEDITGVVVSAEDAGERDPRVTRVGGILRKTHLDEAPQLWSVLIGEMSVVGPRPAQSEIEDDFEEATPDWGKRWFVKPGLTGLAQINDATGHEPEKKLHYDLQYIQKQSIVFDLKIVLRQFWKVGTEVHDLIRGRE